VTRIFDVESKFNEVKQYLLALQVREWERHFRGEGGEDPLRHTRQLFEVFFHPKVLSEQAPLKLRKGPC
jgi:hypothetical protein